jgi:hypothetical protein
MIGARGITRLMEREALGSGSRTAERRRASREREEGIGALSAPEPAAAGEAEAAVKSAGVV